MSGVGFRKTGLDSLFASKPVGPGFEPCLGQSAKLAGAPIPLCLSVLSTWKVSFSGRGGMLWIGPKEQLDAWGRQDKKITSFQPAWLIKCSTPH